MKQKDMIMIGVISFIGAIISFFISGLLFGTPSSRETQVPKVQPIAAEIPKPDKKYFNDKSVDPVKLIIIDDNSNTAPFGAGAQ